MPRMRLLKEAFNEIKQHDPDTALTLNGLRRLALTGQIPHCRIGNKILINMENLENHLRGFNMEAVKV